MSPSSDNPAELSVTLSDPVVPFTKTRRREMKRFLAGVVIVLGLATALHAGPLEPNRVAEDAKWILHMNFDTFRQTQLAEQIREKKLDESEVQRMLDWVQKRYGINLREDLHGLTFYGNSYERHEGVALLMADFDRQKTLEILKDAPGHRTTQYRDYTLYTWTADKPKKEGEGKKAEDKGHDDGKVKHTFTMTAALHENVVVLARDPEKVKKALDVLDDKQRGLKKDSPLVGKQPEGTVFYGAAIDLAKLKNWKGVFDFPVLQQGERITVAVGEKDDQAFEHVHFVAQSEEVVQKLQQVLEGFQAMLELHAKTKPYLAKIADGMEWKIEGKTISYDWKADASAVMQVLEQMRKRAKAMERWEEMLEDKWEREEHKEKKEKGKKT
jgi:hypothetical protein